MIRRVIGMGILGGITAGIYHRDRVRQCAREQLLTESERELDGRVETVEESVRKLRGEWGGVRKALESADVWGEDLELSEVDILVVAGRQNRVEGAGFGRGMFVTGDDHYISHCDLRRSNGGEEA